jgi:hypothetical protein
MYLTHEAVALDSASIYSSSATRGLPLGTKGVDRFGRVYRRVKAGASALVVGNVIQAPAQDTAHQQLTPSVTAIGATTLVATLGASAAAANLYQDGLAVIDTTPGLGYNYAIASHLAVLASGVITLQLPAESAIQVALDANSRVSLQVNPYQGVIQCPATTLTGDPLGVAVYPVAANEFGWIGTRGTFGVLITGTPGAGLSVGVPCGTAGAVLVDSAAIAGYVQVGRMHVTGVAGKVQAVHVNLE